MKKNALLACLLLTALLSACNSAQPDPERDKAEIRDVLRMQETAWSNHDIDGFMTGYLESDSITYFGSSGIRKGYRAMLESYKARYPTPAHTGTLRFTLHDISPLAPDVYWVMGAYHLTREAGDASGTFMIILKKIDGAWKIIGDSSC